MTSRVLFALAVASAFVMLTRTMVTVDAQEGSNVGNGGARTVWSGVFTAAQADRGGAVYAQSCANCHGGGLEGADMSPALAGAAFMASWNDLTLGDLFERIRISMPADRPGTLSRQQMADVIAFVLRSNQFPAGATELPTEAPALRAMKFVMVKP
ncbi:MAG TPA: cytochrome c [Vicinamibacterales bacterium]|jgi:mono/diheme cytochrome c family protein